MVPWGQVENEATWRFALVKNLIVTDACQTYRFPLPPALPVLLTHAGACGMPTDLSTAVFIAMLATQQHFCQLFAKQGPNSGTCLREPGARYASLGICPLDFRRMCAWFRHLSAPFRPRLTRWCHQFIHKSIRSYSFHRFLQKKPIR